MRKPIVMGGAAAFVIVLVGASYFSPELTMYQMKSAIDSKDAVAFSEHVDFPALRESLKGQIMASMQSKMSSGDMKDNPFAGLGMAIGVAMVGPMLDAMVSPAGVIAMMTNDKNASPLKPVAQTASEPSATPAPQYSVTYKSWSTVVAERQDGARNAASFVFKRDGLWSWKLAGVNLPPDAMR